MYSIGLYRVTCFSLLAPITHKTVKVKHLIPGTDILPLEKLVYYRAAAATKTWGGGEESLFRPGYIVIHMQNKLPKARKASFFTYSRSMLKYFVLSMCAELSERSYGSWVTCVTWEAMIWLVLRTPPVIKAASQIWFPSAIREMTTWDYRRNTGTFSQKKKVLSSIKWTNYFIYKVLHTNTKIYGS